ncbi:alpha/beta-hydrolase [Durotheca rogersii]|uniref:alpha/beta-hydrolase n=1 Tax=Durotheca rogersii TaxID=419775 RepID=UPI002220EA5B|nr:alpha/beta-hydrolase [Durotheca rogersii]KAI5861412.1 alpha/beta-hydrolase [Durotheca rogersii]
MSTNTDDQEQVQSDNLQGAHLATQPRHPLLSRLAYGGSLYAIQVLGGPLMWLADWYPWFYPPTFAPTIVKTYACRPSLPTRIFFPKSYDRESSQTPLPTLITIHGGGFCLGRTNEDDEWNARFADTHHVLVVSLEYRKAPYYPFPTALHDVEALILAVFDDESLPVDKSRIALTGFSAGGNLSLTVCQLPSIRDKVKPSAALPVYPVVDQSVAQEFAIKTRYYKPDLGPGGRSKPTDFLAWMVPAFGWAYINPGQSLEDPLISPIYAPRDALPPHLFFVGAELDQLAHGAWRMASKLAGRPVPSLTEKVGQQELAPKPGQLILDDERFAFEHVDEDGKSSVRWLLVPDQLHGFDRLPWSWHGSAESVEDAKLKEVAYQKVMGEWLRDFVWK